MALFSRKAKDPFPGVTEISAFPRIGSAVLKVGTKLVVFAPAYLLGKHGAGSAQVGSKFLELKTAMQLLKTIKAYVTPAKLTGDRVELPEIDIGMVCGYDTLVEITPALAAVLPKEDVRGTMISIIYTQKERIPTTTKMNFILVKFNPKFGQGVENLFKEKYGGNVGFENFEAVYAILTMFPGKMAPPFSDTKYWASHAFLKDITQAFAKPK